MDDDPLQVITLTTVMNAYPPEEKPAIRKLQKKLVHHGPQPHPKGDIQSKSTLAVAAPSQKLSLVEKILSKYKVPKESAADFFEVLKEHNDPQFLGDLLG